eukprot:m.32704 g.32704  ORF g.32704 m.32704 type:complete len:486 (-) comp5028_c0_seq2:103-1560(-)
MAKKITQATFDAVVAENQSEFGMSQEEAIADAITQFEAQGIDLAGIVKGVSEEGGRLPEFRKLAALVADKSSPDEFAAPIAQALASLADKDLRTYAGKQNALPVLLMTSAHLAEQGRADLVASSLDAAAQLLDGQPDLLCPPPGQLTEDIIVEDMPANEATKMLCTSIRKFPEDPAVVSAGFAVLTRACIKHELNRQAFVDQDMVVTVITALRTHGAHVGAVVAASDVIRAITLDDDVRVPFGKAHTAARAVLVEHDGLGLLVGALRTLLGQADAVPSLATTISKLAVRSEFCQQIVDAGGAAAAMEAMGLHTASANVQQSCCSLVKAVAGNDNVKNQLAACGAMEAVVAAMQAHLKSAAVIEQGCAAIAALCLRHEGNCRTAAAAGAACVISNGMHVHAASARVQRQACQALRNMVARVPELRDTILGEGVETRIRAAMTAHQSCGDAGKSALRDLGCQVELRELWTGTAGLGPEQVDDGGWQD